MHTSHVHRVRLEDGEGLDDYILLNVVDRSKKNALELELEGTEGELPYYASFTTSDVAAASSFSDDSSADVSSSFLTTIRTILLRQDPPSIEPSSISLTASLKPSPDTETTTSKSKSSKSTKKPRPPLTLTFRQTSSSASSPRVLGTLILPVSPSHEIDTLSWCASSVSRADALDVQCRSAERRAADSEARAEKAETELKRTTHEKATNEDKMLRAFVGVLNEKKSKVRQLQKALAEGRVAGDDGEDVKMEDGNEAQEKETTVSTRGKKAASNRDTAASKAKTAASRKTDSSRKAESSRKTKRKAETSEPSPSEKQSPAHTSQNDDESEDDDDGGFEPMRKFKNESDRDADSEEGAHTSEGDSDGVPPFAKRGIGKLGGIGGRSQKAKASKDDEESGKEIKPQIGKLGGIGGRNKQAGEQKAAEKRDEQARERSERVEVPQEGEAPPPVRNLPFGRRMNAQAEESGRNQAQDDQSQGSAQGEKEQETTGGNADEGNEEDVETSDDEL